MSLTLQQSLLDQKVAGIFRNRNYAFVPVTKDGAKPWTIGIAVQDEYGYHEIEGEGLDFKWAPDAQAYADAMNDHRRLQPDVVARIIASSMRRPA